MYLTKTRKIGRHVFKIRKPEDSHTFIFNQSELQGEYKEFIEKFMDIDLDHLIESVGSEGRYQYTLII